MDKRRVAEVALIAGGAVLAWFASQQDGGGVYAPVNLDPGDGSSGDPGGAGPGGVSSGYLASLSLAEDPSQDPYAKNPYSTASGLYQFTKATWTSLGGDWGDDPTQAFGGLTPSAAEQTAMAQKLTSQNSSILTSIGAAVDNATLYTMHIFGAGTGPKVVTATAGADPSTPLASLPGVGSKIVSINPALGTTVGSFLTYLANKVG